MVDAFGASGMNMAREASNQGFLNSSFLDGGNAAYIEDLYARYQQNPSSVDESWRTLFEQMRGDDRSSIEKSAKGPSWKKPGWPLIANGELVAALDGNWDATEIAVGNKIKGKAQAKGVELSEAEVQQATRDSVKALMMIRAFRMRGHLEAKLDPLGMEPEAPHPELDPASYGFTEADLDRKIFIDHVLGLEFASVREMIEILRRTYCHTIGIEFMHMSDPEEKAWLQERIEGPDKEITFTREGKRAILNKLIEAEGFEKFIDVNYTGT
jgi:2-oxoglutarate dehydrogenase E1 component